MRELEQKHDANTMVINSLATMMCNSDDNRAPEQRGVPYQQRGAVRLDTVSLHATVRLPGVH